MGLKNLETFLCAAELGGFTQAAAQRGFAVEIWKQLFCHRDKWISPQMQAVIGYCAAM